MNNSGKNIRFYIYAAALLPFLLLLATGIILLKYHTGAHSNATILGQDAYFWFPFHKITAVISTLFIALHLFVKTNWVKHLFTGKLKGAFKASNLILFVVFLLCVFTGFGSDLISSKLGGVHNKFGLILIVMFLTHIWNYRKVIIGQVKKIK